MPRKPKQWGAEAVQPPDTTICGQVAVALITGAPLSLVITMFGHSHTTRTKEIVRALTYFGYRTDGVLRRAGLSDTWPALGIGKMQWRNPEDVAQTTQKYWRSGSHWVIIRNGKIQDGHVHKDDTWGGGLITSWLRVLPPDEPSGLWKREPIGGIEA